MPDSTSQLGSPLNVGLVGCGHISPIYLKNLQVLPEVEVVACADLDLDRARVRAEEFQIPKSCSYDDLLANPEVEIVLNLTVPKAHAEVTMRALRAGKHVYSEKPLAVEREDARGIIELASELGLSLGCAPDTVLGSGYQTCRNLIDGGAIGQPVAASAFFMSRGQEHWHPNPHFFYQRGAGPLFDMGPYRLTALVTLLGPIARVSGMARISFAERIATSETRYGERIAVETPTHVTALLQFTSGPICTFVSSFDVVAYTLPPVEIYGAEGTLRCPDPDAFKGPARLKRTEWSEWEEAYSDSPHSENWRGLGLADMARAIRDGGTFRANAEIAYHVLDVMHAILEASESGRQIDIQSTCSRPEPLRVRVTFPSKEGAAAVTSP